MKRPRALLILAVLTMVVGGFRSCTAVNQLLAFTQGRDTFVSAVRDHTDGVSALQQMSSTERQKLGEELGEREWSRRGVTIPLGLVNLVLGFLLFAGAMQAVKGSAWGHGAWEWAARLSVLSTAVATALQLAQARGMEALMATMMRQGGAGPAAETMAGFSVMLMQMVAVGVGIVATAFYVTCAWYLRRPATRALFPPAPSSGKG